jgi:hypothetical protein
MCKIRILFPSLVGIVECLVHQITVLGKWVLFELLLMDAVYHLILTTSSGFHQLSYLSWLIWSSGVVAL